MTVATRLKHFLECWKVNYMVLNHSPTTDLYKAAALVSIPRDQVITGTILFVQKKPILCVHRLSDVIDTELVAKFYNIAPGKVTLSSIDNVNQYFSDCDPKVSLPFGEPYSLPSLIDSAIKQLPYLYFSGGGVTSLLRLSRDDFAYLSTQSRFSSITTSSSLKKIPKAYAEPFSASISEKENHKLEALRDVPDYVVKIVEMGKLHVDIDTFQNHLVQHIPFHALFYPSKESNRSKFSVVSHVATKPSQKSLSYGMLKTGPLGLDAIWKNSLCAAELARKLSWLIKIPNFSFSSELAYCCGLFHHFGYLVYGHLYTPEFNLLSRQWQLNQYNLPIRTFEKRMLTFGGAQRWVGGGHTKMGASLLSYWGLDSVIVRTAEHHHDENYKGVGAEYIRLIYLCDQLLAYFGRGDGVLPLDQSLVNQLGLSIENTIEITSKIVKAIFPLEQDNTHLSLPISTQ